MRESTSHTTTVVGLFRDIGSAENARNRLKTEDLSSEDRMVLKVLKETAPPPPTTQEELDTLSLDPLFAILGGLRHHYVRSRVAACAEHERVRQLGAERGQWDLPAEPRSGCRTSRRDCAQEAATQS